MSEEGRKPSAGAYISVRAAQEISTIFFLLGVMVGAIFTVVVIWIVGVPW